MSENMDSMSGPDDAYELDELLGAYALDALDDAEQRRVDDYLRINPRAAAEVRDHREVATMLAFTGMDAPAGIWSKIADEIDSTAPPPGPELARVLAIDSDSTRSLSADTPPAGAETPDTTVVPMRRSRSSWFLGAAAAVAVVFAGVAVVATGSDDSVDPLGDAYATASAAEGTLRAELVAVDSSATATGVLDVGGNGYLDAADLPRLDDDLTYQLWGVLADTGDVVSIGILGDDPGLETFTVDGDVAALAVTIERAPGVVSDGNPDGAFVGELG